MKKLTLAVLLIISITPLTGCFSVPVDIEICVPEVNC